VGDLVITGWGAVCAAGVGAEALRGAVSGGPREPADITTLYPGPMPSPVAHAYPGFDVRALLGRKGTGFLDRATSLAMVACGQALEDGAVLLDDDHRDRVGVALGTTVGSFQSSSDYSRETLVSERPYLVNPVLFPNTVMNCASGQSAIRYGLRGVNSTIAGGRTGFLAALRYAANALRRGYVDTMLVGAVEEFTPHTAWLHHHLDRAGLPGEAAVVFALRADPVPDSAVRARIRSVVSGFQPDESPGAMSAALVACIRRALDRAGADAAEVALLATGECGEPGADDIENAAAAEVFAGLPVERIAVRDALGDCGAANGALHLAAVLSRVALSLSVALAGSGCWPVLWHWPVLGSAGPGGTGWLVPGGRGGRRGGGGWRRWPC